MANQEADAAAGEVVKGHGKDAAPIILKISGEALGGRGGYDEKRIKYFVDEMTALMCADETQRIVVVIGGGNIIRGEQMRRIMSQPGSDYAGMLASALNGVVLRNVLKDAFKGAGPRVMHMCMLEGVRVDEYAGSYSHYGVMDFFSSPGILIISSGTGKPGVSTDSGVITVAENIGAKLVIKGTKVDGIFSGDPRTDPDARLLPQMTHAHFLRCGFRQIFDPGAVKRAGELGIEIRVINFFLSGCLLRAVRGESIGSLISSAD